MHNPLKDRKLILMCVSAFILTISVNIFWVSIPFLVKAAGGSDSMVGLCFTANLGLYLLGCFAVRGFLDKLDPYKTAVTSNIFMFIILGVLYLTVLSGAKSNIALIVLIFAAAVQGAATAFYWPPMMGCVSRGYEGADLNKRLGLYNASWSGSEIAGVLLGGFLDEWNLAGAMGICTLIMGLAVIATSLTKMTVAMPFRANSAGFENADVNQLTARFKTISRVGVISAFICVGAVRSQLGLLLKFELGWGESMFGIMLTFVAAAVWVGFVWMGRTHFWHYNTGLFAVIQILFIPAMCLIIFSKSFAVICAAAVVVGIGKAFMYKSHLFYNISGTLNRSRAMAVHEAVLSIGFVAGFFCGGFISDMFGRYAPYWFCIAAIAAAIAVEFVLYHRPLRRAVILPI